MVKQDQEMTRKAYIEALHQELDEWEEKIAQMKTDVHNTRPLKSAWQRPVETDVRARLETLEKRILDLKLADEEHWREVKPRVEEAREELADTYEGVRSQYVH